MAKHEDTLEQTVINGNSKWSLAARDGLILAAVTVVISTLTLLTENSILSFLLWAVKLVGSIWLLRVILKRYADAHPGEPVFGYGVLVCVLSALVCAVWAFVQYQFLFPDAIAKAFEQLYASFEEMGSMMPEGFTDVLLKMEDNYAQINCITTFFWCSLLGLLFSAILSRAGAKKSVFTDEELQQGGDDEFNF